MERWVFSIAALGIVSCSINRTENGEREGFWVEKTKIGDKTYQSRGRYKNGFECRTWKYFEDGKLVKKESYRDSICRVTHFKNKKKILEGYTKVRITDTMYHWFYTGEWREFDTHGNLVAKRNYNNGELVHEIEFE